jgi:hypothetical protein
MKTFKYILFHFLLAAFFACGPQESNQNETHNQMNLRFLALGDSYTIGEGVAENERWPNQLKDSLDSEGLANGGTPDHCPHRLDHWGAEGRDSGCRPKQPRRPRRPRRPKRLRHPT